LNSFESECISIESIFKENNLNVKDVSAIKIDIEGHEEFLLQDKFLMNLDLPMHISLHPTFSDNTENFYENIKPFLIIEV